MGVQTWKFSKAVHGHLNYSTGEECFCGFTKHLHPHFHKVATKLDWLKGRPDMQDKQRLLTLFEGLPEKCDPILPWLAREVKKGRIQHSDQGNIGHLYMMVPVNAQGLPAEEGDHVVGNEKRNIRPAEMAHWADWFNAKNHITRRGVDLMQLQVYDLLERVAKWDEDLRNREAQEGPLSKGQVVHEFPDGWTIRRLTDAKQCEAEGDAMGHCVGGYGNHVENGDTTIYSLRDPKHMPHVTAEIEPEYNKVFDLDHALEREPIGHAFPDDLVEQLRHYDQTGEVPGPDAAHIPELHATLKRKHVKHVPIIGHGGTVHQIYGKGNETPKPEYKARLREWFDTWTEKPISNQERDYYGATHHEDLEDVREMLNPMDTQDDYGLERGLPADPDWGTLVRSVVDDRYRGYRDYADHDAVEKIHAYALMRPGAQTAEGRKNLVNWNQYTKAIEDWQMDAYDKFAESYEYNYVDDGYEDDPDLTPDENADRRNELHNEYMNEDWKETAEGKALDHFYGLINKHYDRDAGRYVHPSEKPFDPPKPSTFSSWKLADLELPQIVEGKKHAVDSPFFGWFGRSGTRPVIYDPAKNLIMVGQFGTHHFDVMEEFGYTQEGLDPSMYTSETIGEPQMPDVHFALIEPGVIHPSRMGLRTWGPRYPEVEQALAQAGLITAPEDELQKPWHFGAAKLNPIADFEHAGLDPTRAAQNWSKVNEGWKPGKTGQGILVGKSLFTWKSDEKGPNHTEIEQLMAALNMPEPSNYLLHISEKGDYDLSFDEPEHHDIIQRADPRLKTLKSEWSLGRTADFWDEERRKDFPEDFHEDPFFGDLATTPMKRYNPAEIKALVAQGWTSKGHRGEGKALQTPEGEIAWDVDLHGGPHHNEVSALFPQFRDGTPMNIDITGTRVNTYDDIEQWKFGSEAQSHHLDWVEGYEGLGILDGNGVLFTWDADDHETHSHFEQAHPEVAPGGHYLYIDHNGKVSTVWGTLDEGSADAIREADPRLHVEVGRTEGWKFGAERNYEDHWSKEPESMMAQAEWVPTKALVPYLEYDRRPTNTVPGVGAQPDYYEALKGHIAQHGVNSPIYLDWNPKTNKGHISEGNHRLAIAHELGHEHVPVIIYRSRREGDKSRDLHFVGDETKYHDFQGTPWWPQYMKPSEFGFPVRTEA